MIVFLSCVLLGLIALSVQQTTTLSGDTQCSTLMCVAAVVNGTDTIYTLSGLGKQPFGWMGVGFGREMSNSPMVILWVNSDNSVTASQRKAPQEVMPTVDPNPPRRAELALDFTTISSTAPKLAFKMPTVSDQKQNIVFAYGTTRPSSSAADAELLQHLDYGISQLNLAAPFPTTTTPTSSPDPTSSSITPVAIPLSSSQKTIVAHAIFCVIGFLVLLPFGALVARYMRTFNPIWFKCHWITQFWLAGGAIVLGVVLGLVGVQSSGSKHLNDKHKKWGIVIFLLYAFQCGVGAFIHFVKNLDRKRRPIQNYFHAVFGLTVIGLSFYQVHLGYHAQWPKSTGRDPLPVGVSVLFWVWLALLIVLYTLGLFFLRKQYAQERAVKGRPEVVNQFALSETSYRKA